MVEGTRRGGANGPLPLHEGAAPLAPTAPHATFADAPPAKRGGPRRFWDPRWLQRTIAGGAVASLLLHAGILVTALVSILLPTTTLEVKDVDGELSIPIDMLAAPAEPPPPPPPPPPEPEKPAETAEGSGKLRPDAGHRPQRDAGIDGGDEAGIDAGRITDGGAEGGIGEAGAALDSGIASADGGAEGLIAGAGGGLAADKVNVQLLVNMAVIRTNPVGARMGPMLSAIPEWDDFIAGTHVDPIRDTDWVLIVGPSLVHTEKDVILVHYSASDAVVDSAVSIVAKKWVGHGGVFDAGVPGVKASIGHADFAPRVFLRAQSHVLAVVPPYYANTAAKTLKQTTVWPPQLADVAMRLILESPHRPINAIPETVQRLRLRITTKADGGAQISGEGDCATNAEATSAADAIRRLLSNQNSLLVSMATQNLLGGAQLGTKDNKVTLEIAVSAAQIEATVSSIAAFLGASLAPAPSPAPTGSFPRR